MKWGPWSWVFAVDPSEVGSINGVEVPEHGAFVARLLPPDLTAGPSAGLPASGGGGGVGGSGSGGGGGGGSGGREREVHYGQAVEGGAGWTPVWCRDAAGGCIVVPVGHTSSCSPRHSHCSPRHKMPLPSRTAGSTCV
jgi:hypothetical protein